MAPIADAAPVEREANVPQRVPLAAPISTGGRVRTTARAVAVAVLGAAPHVLHHAGPLAGAALLAGATGRVLFAAETTPWARRGSCSTSWPPAAVSRGR
jgi:hypothetical protein